jgi:predicted dehydrogenase
LPSGRQVIVSSCDYAGSFARIIEDFALAASGQKKPIMPGRHGLEDLKVVMAAYRSVESGRAERVQG